jgi:hypothetical protein
MGILTVLKSLTLMNSARLAKPGFEKSRYHSPYPTLQYGRARAEGSMEAIERPIAWLPSGHDPGAGDGKALLPGSWGWWVSGWWG